MIRRFLFAMAFAILTLVLLVSGSARASGLPNQGKIVVANRSSGTISVIDVASDTLLGTFALPGDMPAEPMYVVYNQIAGRVFVDDRANSQVVVFDPDDFTIEATVPAGSGVFHMWADLYGTQLWVTNDVDNTATVIDPRSLEVLATVPMPADLVAQGGKPHDVIVDRAGRFAYVTMLGFAGEHDYVVQFSTQTFRETSRAAVGKDPHLSLTQRNHDLYVPAQGNDVVHVLDRRSLEPVTDISVPGAHGAGMRRDGRFFYTTNLPGGGANGLVAIDTSDNSVIGATDTPYPVPHNIALTPDGEKLYLTHSGPTANKVTVYTATNSAPVPTLVAEVTVEFNPFGLAYVP